MAGFSVTPRTILYMHISRIINPCIIKQGTVHFDFLLQRGAKLVSICVAGQTNAIYRLRCTSLHRGRGISPLVENLNSFSFQSQEAWGRGGQTPSSERHLLRTHHIYHGQWAAPTSARKACSHAEWRGCNFISSLFYRNCVSENIVEIMRRNNGNQTASSGA